MKKLTFILLILFSYQAKSANFIIDAYMEEDLIGGIYSASWGIEDSLGNLLYSETITYGSLSFPKTITVPDVGKYRIFCNNQNPYSSVGISVVNSFPSTTVNATYFNNGGTTISDLFEYNFPAPIQFENVTINQNPQSDLIYFNTISETNCDKFIIQHSTDLANYSDLISISSKANNGNSSESLNYFYENKNFNQGNNYYRIKQIDNDGHFNYSKIVKSYRANIKKEFSIFPNPIKDKIYFQFYTDNIYDIEILLVDVLGNNLKKIKSKSLIGNNDIEINTDNFNSNYYFTKVYIDGDLLSFNKILIDK